MVTINVSCLKMPIERQTLTEMREKAKAYYPRATGDTLNRKT